jgi:hypothetical protein
MGEDILSKRMLTVALVVAVCTACSSKHPVQQTAVAGPCVGDAQYEQVKIRIEHDATNAPANATIPVIQPVTIYWEPDSTKPTHKGKVCWVIEPVDSNGTPSQLWTSLVLESKDGTALFDKWTKKQKMPGDSLYINAGTRNKKTPKWEYSLKYGGLEVDPVIIVIDDTH